LPPTAPLEVDSATLDDYREFLTDDLRTRLDGRILSMRDEQGEALSAELDALYRDLHSIKGSANFLGATATVATVHLLEDCLGLVKQRIALLDAEFRQQLIDSFLLGLDLVWELRAGVLQERDEGPRLAAIADRHLAFQEALLATAGRLAGQATAASGPLADMF
jgi:chemotaxis protein histidine kinase CheA